MNRIHGEQLYLAQKSVNLRQADRLVVHQALQHFKRKGLKIKEQLLLHLSPLGWEHVNLTGGYIWKSNRIPGSGKFRRLRPAKVETSKNSLNV
ncbi:Tn3 family transposase [Citrobacter koseri]|uniref:Tn3 family transposase n=1 Tax=Citrobacter koseri TaxID=545 RepID=UPI0035A5FE27